MIHQDSEGPRDSVHCFRDSQGRGDPALLRRRDRPYGCSLFGLWRLHPNAIAFLDREAVSLLASEDPHCTQPQTGVW